MNSDHLWNYHKAGGTNLENGIRLDYNNMMSDTLGAKGIDAEEISSIREAMERAHKNLCKKREAKSLEWMDIIYNNCEEIEEIISFAKEIKDSTETFVVLGIGGSALGPAAVHHALKHPYYNELNKEKREGWPRFYVVDNVDPERLSGLLDIIDIRSTVFNCITKSGNTIETMSQFMIVKDLLEKELGKEEAKKHIICTTDRKNGALIKVAEKEGYKTFFIPSKVGGRFSELSPVGLLPAACCGIDIKELIRGAVSMDKAIGESINNPAYMYAALSCISLDKDKNISVIMPYADSLKLVADWYSQLWAESLGKKHDIYGNEVNVGQTPVRALGATDQHSQMQLFVEGPDDKIIVIIGLDKYKRDIAIPVDSDIDDLGFLRGATHGNMISIEQMSAEYALLKAGKSNMTITLPEVNEYYLGQLIFMFEVATAFAGELLNINAFDQPGVEEGKNAAYAMFGRKGYEAKKAELDAKPEKKKEYVI